jgi:L-threonylcarbamoyladenylate synthase
LKTPRRVKGTPVLGVDCRHPRRADVAWVAAVIKNGGVAVIPTDTVYGLACDARNPSAIRRLYALKGREARKPLACLTAYTEQIMALSPDVPEEVWKAAKAHWPGALTLVAPSGDWLPKELTSGMPTVGVRYPNCPWVWELVEAVEFPIAASSANLSGHPAAVDGAGVIRDWAGKADIIVDGGSCSIGRESTVAGMQGNALKVFRQGALDLTGGKA